MMPGLLATLEKFIMGIFDPIYDFLGDTLSQLYQIQMQPQRYLHLDYFLGPISMLGPGWVALISSIIASLTIIFITFATKSLWNLYLQFKEGIKWW